MSKKFLVAVDGSEHGWKALDLATDLAKPSAAQLVVLHVVPYEPVPAGLEEWARLEGIPAEAQSAHYYASQASGDEITGEAERRARQAGIAKVITRGAKGSPAKQIVAMAESIGADMIFIGSRGLGDAKGLIMGSVSHKVMHLAPCTCVAVK